MRHRGVIAAIVATALLLALVTPAPAAEAVADAPRPVVSGNALVDSRTGETWVAHAVNWPSFEYACQQGWAYAASERTPEAAAAMSSWGINALRLPLNESCWLGVDGSPAYGTSAGYRHAIAAWVATLNAAGIVVILDLHWSGPQGYAADGQRAMPGPRATTFWQQVATAYADNPSVMFDVFNEPYSRWNAATSSWAFQLTWQCWRDGGCLAPVENDRTGTLSGATFPVTGMAALVGTIGAAGAAQPILLGGLDYSNDLRGWLAYRPSDSQLVAAWHNYPGQRCSTTTCWNAEIAPVAAVVPVIAGEFGQTDGGSSFLTTFMTWSDAHGLGYAPWAWWFTDASDGTEANRYALVSSPDFAPRAPSGTAYHDHLAGLGSPPDPGSPEPVTVYRFWSPGAQSHFYTASVVERDEIIRIYGADQWQYEGAAYTASSTPAAGTVPVYRFWSQRYQGHFYTTSDSEKNAVIANYTDAEWLFENVAYHVYPATPAVPDTNPVARFWSQRTGHHFYTADAVEAQYVEDAYDDATWASEGDAFRVSAAAPTAAPMPDNKDCADFATWSGADAWFRYYFPRFGDVAQLDPDHDLVPCPQLAGAP